MIEEGERRMPEMLGWALKASPLGLGLIVGLAVTAQLKVTVAAMIGVGLGVVGLVWPPALVAGMWLGMLFDRLGLTGMRMGGFPITASKLTVLGSIVLWALHAGLTRSPLFRWHPVLTAMMVFLATTGITTVYSNCWQYGKYHVMGLVMMAILIMVVSAALEKASLRPLYRFLGAMFILALAASIRSGGGSSEYGRSAGTMGDPNEWATMVIMLTPFFLGGLASDDHELARPVRMGLVMLAPLAVLVSASRTALVMGALISPGCLWLFRARRGELLACAGTAVLVAPFVLDLGASAARLISLVENFRGGATVEDVSFVERSELFRQGKQLFLDNWGMGAGPGNFSRSTGFISHEGLFRPAHDTYLEVASEQGVFGLTAFFVFLGTVAYSLISGFMAATRDEDQNRVMGLTLGLGAFALMAVTLGLLTFSMAYLMLGFGLAVLYQARQPEPQV